MKKKIMLAAVTVMGLSLLAGCSTTAKNYSKYVTLGEYKGMEYVEEDTTVTDEEVLEHINQELESATTYVDTGSASKMGDYINIDYVGTVDGMEFEGGSTNGNGTYITIGSSGYIDNFDEQLVGHNVGETFDVNVTFPEDYSDNPEESSYNLNGKDAVFSCTINSIQVENAPELTDEWVKENSTNGDQTVEEYKASEKKELIKKKEESAKKSKKETVVQAAVKNATINGYRDDEVDAYIDDLIENVKTAADSYGLEQQTYIMYVYGASSEAEFEQKITEATQEALSTKMVITMIAKAEGIRVNKKEIADHAKKLASDYGLESVDTVYEYYTDEDLAYEVLYDKVADFLCENAKAVDHLADEEASTEAE